MARSLLIGRVAGIKILIHWSFLLLLGWIVFSEINRGSNATTVFATIGFVIALFGCVVLHELGHSLTAKRFGIDTTKITLLPIGGVASLERIPEDPKQELWVALAGPAVNVIIAGILYPFVFYNGFLSTTATLNVSTVEGFLYALFRVNIALILFNIIPAFPMDGGRVLRALLAFRLGRIDATNIAASLGQLIAMGFVLFGLFNNLFLVLIGVFVYFGAQTEKLLVQHLAFLKDYTVRNAMMTNFITLSPTDTVKDAAEKLLAGSDQDLLVVDNERAIGVMTKVRIIDSLRGNQPDRLVTEVMETNFDTLEVNDSLTEVYANVQRKPNTSYPVMENNKLRGIIDLTNLKEFVMIRSALHYSPDA
ncbi:MAG: site-2 protease family protein [Bacteroidota bacterium]